MNAPQKINFTVSPKYLIELIQGQTDGLDKAFGELIMNSVDANAKSIHITMNEIEPAKFQFTFFDDGKGFSKKDILNYFKVFGNPHSENDATFGRFRMGRSQILYYAKTQWYTRKYLMDIDIYEPLRNKSIQNLGFNLSNTDERVDGCHIYGELYSENLSYFFKIDTLKEQVKELVKYVDIDVFFNGELITQRIKNIDRKAFSLSYEDDVAWYFMDHSFEDLKLYNQGVWVQYNDLSQHMAKGIIITKSSLALDHSRRTILTERCPVYKQISKTLTDKVDQKFLVKFDEQKLDTPTFVRQALKFMCQINDFTYNEAFEIIMNEPIIADYREREYSLKQLLNVSDISVLSDQDASHVERIERVDQIFIADANNGMLYTMRYRLTNAEGKTFQYSEILNIFNKICQSWVAHHSQFRSIEYVDFNYKTICPSDDKYISKSTTLEAISLNQEQLALLQYLNQMNDALFTVCPDIQGISEKRVIQLGKGDNANAWTNGITTIWFDVDSVSNRIQTKNHHANLTTLIHEYCHNPNSTSGHDLDFYRTFHDFVNYQNLQLILELMS